jgi:hypothetical protein
LRGVGGGVRTLEKPPFCAKPDTPLPPLKGGISAHLGLA